MTIQRAKSYTAFYFFNILLVFGLSEELQFRYTVFHMVEIRLLRVVTELVVSMW